MLDLLKRKVRAQPLQLNIRELTRVIHQTCSVIPKQYIHRHMLSISTRYLAVDATPVGCTSIETKLNTTSFDCAVLMLRVSMLTLLVEFVPVSFVVYVRNKLYYTYIWLVVFVPKI